MLNKTSSTDISAAISASGRSVKLNNIIKRYGTFVAVNDVSFELEKGEFLTLLGPSGSGKTSTLMMVAGFDAPTSGEIIVDGKNFVGLSPQHRNFGVVFQGYALFPHMTALENVEFPLRMRKYPADRRRKLALEMLDKVGLGALTQRRPRELSGGQQQRVALARALVFQPHALLLDEPLGALDKNMRERMQYEIKELQRSLGISILFVTHDQEEAMTMSDRIAVMNEGGIVQIGTPSEVYKHPHSAFVAGFLGETNMVQCTVKERANGQVAVGIANGRTGYASLSPGRPHPAEGASALLSVRPEKMVILDQRNHADFVIDGVVREHTFVGKHSRTVIEAIGMTFSVISGGVDAVEGLEVGSDVRLGWMAKDAQLIVT